MDLLRELGPLALGSRLRRLMERMVADGTRVYRLQEFDFEPRWFPLFYLLSSRAPVSVGEAANALGVSHVAVSQLVKELQRRRLVSSTRDRQDTRRRRLQLTARARALLPALLPLWNDFEAATQELIDAAGDDLLAAIRATERALDERSFFERIASRTRTHPSDLEIIDYEPEHREAFERLNRAWLERDFTVDAADLRVMRDPEGQLIEPGGAVLLARRRGKIVGCCGLQPRGPSQLELVKMAVDERERGAGIGVQLGQAAVRRARQLGARRLVLESNSRLHPALAVYRRLGFERAESESLVHERADVWMTLDLDHSGRGPDGAFRIAPFEPEHQAQVVHLILGIQAGEFSIPITAADQPDLADIPGAYQKDGCFFVTLDGGRVVGTIGLIRFAREHAALRKMFVARSHRGESAGVSAALLGAALDWARDSGLRTITLGTISILAAAHRFYEKSGFQRIDADDLPPDFPRMAVDDRFYRLRLR